MDLLFSFWSTIQSLLLFRMQYVGFLVVLSRTNDEIVSIPIF